MQGKYLVIKWQKAQISSRFWTYDQYPKVIPKKEVDYVFDLNEQTYSGLMGYSRKMAKAMDQALKPIRIAMTVEGLEVPHAHVHLIPIYSEGGPFRLGHSIKLKKEEMRTISEQIAKHLDQ